jgi:hypothetical protein
LKDSVLFIAMATLFGFSSPVAARSFGVLKLPIHAGKLTSSVLYGHSKSQDDFEGRGVTDFRGNLVGSRLSFGLNDQISVSLDGGVIVDPSVNTQGDEWGSRNGHFFGINLQHEIFPATGVRPGVQLSAGLSRFFVPLDRFVSDGIATSVDQQLTGLDYHGEVVATWHFKVVRPYAGLKGQGRSVRWRNNRPSATSAALIKGHADKNLSIVVGVPVQITKDICIQAEASLLSETLLTAGITIASF